MARMTDIRRDTRPGQKHNASVAKIQFDTTFLSWMRYYCKEGDAKCNKSFSEL